MPHHEPDAPLLPPLEERLAMLSVLQELTAAALVLFDPERPVDDFLDRLATRLLCTAALCVEIAAPGATPRLLGAAGLPREALATDLSALRACGASPEAWTHAPWPIPTLAAPSRTTWAFVLDDGPVPPDEPLWLLLLFFDGAPTVSARYRRMVARLATHLRTALRYRRLYARSLESEQTLRSLNAELVRDAAALAHGAAEREELLQREREGTTRYRALLDAVPDLIFRMRLDGTFLDFHAKRPGDLLIPPEMLRGGNVRTLGLPEGPVRKLFEALDAAHRSGVVQAFEYEAALCGELHQYESRVVISGEDEAILIVRDITERKRAEEAVATLTRDLERRVAERTAELAAANRELESFSYSVSHDLRAPLRAIDGFSQALQEDASDRLDATSLEYLARVRSASQRMAQLIDALLELSRVTRREMHRQPVDLTALAQSIAADLRKTQPEREVEFVIAPDLTASGDPRLLQVLLENLLGNAWKFTGHKPRARIEFGKRQDQADGTVYFVRDNGAGFDMAYAGKLFGAFQRLHSDRQFEGTGIGLATVQRIVLRHGGRVWAEGVPEQGATFYFTL